MRGSVSTLSPNPSEMRAHLASHPAHDAGMTEADSIAAILPALAMFEVRVDRIARALAHDYTIACYCPRCRRWATLDLRRMVEEGKGERPITALRVRCSECHELGALQVRSPMPTMTTAGAWGSRGAV